MKNEARAIKCKLKYLFRVGCETKNPNRYVKFWNENRERIAELDKKYDDLEELRSRMTVKQLADHYDVSVTTIMVRLRKKGLIRPKKGGLALVSARDKICNEL